MYRLLFVIILFILFDGSFVFCQGQFNKFNNTSFAYNKVLKKLKSLKKTKNKIVNLDSVDSLPNTDSKFLQQFREGIQKTSGTIDVGYSYGLNTVFSDSSRGIASIFNTKGLLRTNIFKLPIILSYHYSTLRTPLGANNYFRISFDKKRYLKQKKKAINQKLSKITNINTTIKNKINDLCGIQGYTEVYLNMLSRKIKEKGRAIYKTKKKRFNDSLNFYKTKINDSLNQLKDTKLKMDMNSINKFRKSKTNYDEKLAQNKRKIINSRYQQYKAKYEKILNLYHRIINLKEKYNHLSYLYNKKGDKLESYKSEFEDGKWRKTIEEKGFNKIDFLKSIKKINIGLTYPKTTGLSNQNIAIKGIGTEFQFKNYYLAVSSGLTLNNTMISTNQITNQLKYNQNIFNHFDFQKVKNNGILTVVKTGYGSPKSTHALIGFNYLTNTRFLGIDNNLQSMYNPAASIELDLKYIPEFYRGGMLKAVYGKTSGNRKLDSSLSQNHVFRTLFSGYQSNTFLAKYQQQVSSIHSSFSLIFRSIDPYANTTVYGTMQPGNRRLLFRSHHNVNSHINIGTLYKLEKSYGYNYDFDLHTTGIDISGNYTSYLFYSANLNYVKYNSINSQGKVQKGNSYIAGINLRSQYNLRHLKASTMLTYNNYLFSDTIRVLKYSQFGLSESLGQINWKGYLKYNYFFKKSNGLSKGTNMFEVGFKRIREKVRWNCGISIALKSKDTPTLGWDFKVRWNATPFMEFSIRAQRFILGNFYRTYYNSLYNRFPYLFSFSTKFKI